MPESQIRRRLLSANTTAATAAVAAGMYTVATLATALSLTEAQVRERILALGPSVPSAMGRRRGVEVSLIGTGGDDSTFTAAVYQLKYGVDRSNQNQQTPDFELVPLCLLSATLSAAVGAASGTLVLSTERIADAIVVTVYNPSTTPKGIHDFAAAVYGGVDAGDYSPGGNLPARAIIPECGNGDLFFQLIKGTCTDCNAVVEAVV